jgi:hypothetical protein
VEHIKPFAHCNERRRVVDCLQGARIVRLAQRNETDAAPPRGGKLTLGLFDGRHPDGARCAAAAGEIGQRRKRRPGAAEPIEQGAKRARPDILAADQAQPVKALLIGQADVTGHGLVHSAGRRRRAWFPRRHHTSRTDNPAWQNQRLQG